MNLSFPVDLEIISVKATSVFPSCLFSFVSLQTCRESIYQVLSQTTPENTSKNYAGYSIDPKTRYTRVNVSSIQTGQVRTAILYLLNTDLSHLNPRGGYSQITVEPSV